VEVVVNLSDYEYFRTDLGVLYHGDCLKILPLIEDKVDLCATDFPYGLEYGYDVFDDKEESLINLINNSMPILLKKSVRTLLTCGHTNVQKYPKYDWLLCWFYGTTNAMNKWGFTSWQPILAYGADPYLQNKMGARMDVIKDSHCPSKKKINHPCPKSIEFTEKLILRGSVNKDDLILDPFLGSGTTAVACEKLGRRWIGIEISEKYC
jgi:DNA modification methylase